MPYTTRDRRTGFIEFHKTPEEKSIESLQDENKKLRSEIDAIKAKLGISSEEPAKEGGD